MARQPWASRETLKGNFVMKKAATTRYDVAEHLRTPEEMAFWLEPIQLVESRGV
jgi:hypothetical protein